MKVYKTYLNYLFILFLFIILLTLSACALSTKNTKSHHLDNKSKTEIASVNLIRNKEGTSDFSVTFYKEENPDYQHLNMRGKEGDIPIQKIFSIIQGELDYKDRISKKKKELVNIGPINFHYLNEKLVNSFYDDYFKEFFIEQSIIDKLNSRWNSRAYHEISEAFSVTTIKDLIKNIKIPGLSANEKFRKFQTEAINNDQVILDVELLDIEFTDLDEFDKKIIELKEKFDFTIDKSKIEEHGKLLKKNACEEIIKRLEKAHGWVLLSGKFKITDFSKDYYKLIFIHPVSNFIDDTVTISVVVKKELIKNDFRQNYYQSINREIPIRIYGQIFQSIDPHDNIWDLQISPLAIY